MALIPYTVSRIITSSTTTITAEQTFCDLITAMLASSSIFATLLQDLQTSINNGQDTYKVKVSAGDCPGFLSEKLVSSNTIEVEVLPPVAGCKRIALNVKPPTVVGTGVGTTLSDPCETDWTAIGPAGYAVFLGPSTQLNKTWQGNIEWSINKIGEIKIRGEAFIDSILLIMNGNKSMQLPQTIQNKVCELPDIPCITDKIGQSSDFYGLNYATHILTSGPGGKQTTLFCHLKRIGRSFYIDLSCVIALYGEYPVGVSSIRISFGSLKSIN